MKKSMALIRLAGVLLLLAVVFQVQVPAALSSECTEGQTMVEVTGPMCSCGGTRTPKDRYKCIGGVWVYQSSFCGAPFCQDDGGGGGGCQGQPGSCPYQYNEMGMTCPSYCYCCY